MALFGTDGTASVASGPGRTAVFLLKDSTGHTVKTYNVPAAQADKFEASMQSEKTSLSQSLGKELHLVRITKCF